MKKYTVYFFIFIWNYLLILIIKYDVNGVYILVEVSLCIATVYG